MKLKFYRKLFLDDDIQNNKSNISVDDIITQLNDGIEIYNLKLICVSKHQHHILEILSTKELFKNNTEINNISSNISNSIFKRNTRNTDNKKTKINNSKNHKKNITINNANGIDYVVVGLAYGKKNAFKVIKAIFESYVLANKDLRTMKRNFLDNK